MISEVRQRQRRDKGKGDTCSCGAPFLYIVLKDDGTYSFFWCSRCDIARMVK